MGVVYGAKLVCFDKRTLKIDKKLYVNVCLSVGFTFIEIGCTFIEAHPMTVHYLRLSLRCIGRLVGDLLLRIIDIDV